MNGLSGPEDLLGVDDDDLLGFFRWYDALCIDQSNIPERSQQVALMGEIYRNVEGVVAFLGQSETNLRLAQDFIRDLAAFESERSQAFCQEFVVPRMSTWMACCEGLKLIFEHPWWQRLWIYQEILLAGKAELLLGRGEILEWDILEKAVAVIYRETSKPMSWGGRTDLITETTLNEALWKALKHCGFINAHRRALDRKACLSSQGDAQRLSNLRQIYKLDGPDEHWQEKLFKAEVWENGFSRLLPAIQLEKRVQFTRDLKFCDPRDRIFAILGVVNTATPFIVPDFTKSPQQIYLDFACALVSTTLEFIRDAGLERLAGIYRAADNERVLAEILKDDKTLRTAGYCIDKVDEVFAMPSKLVENVDGLREVLKRFPSLDWESKKHILIRTLTANTDQSGYPLSEVTVQKWTKHLFIFALLHESDDEEAEEVEEVEEDYIDMGYGDWRDATTGFHSVKMTEGRSFARTENGHMALAPQGIRAGDSIYVLPGCSVPLVLRKEEDHTSHFVDNNMGLPVMDSNEEEGEYYYDDDARFLLIGECFVMDGEALQDGRVDMEQISIL